MVACWTVDDSQINNLSQFNISVIQYFEFQGKLLGALQQPKSELSSSHRCRCAMATLESETCDG